MQESASKSLVASFDERRFSQQFQNIFVSFSSSKLDQATALIDVARGAIDKIDKLQTLVNILDKSTKFNLFLGKDFEVKILNRGLFLLDQQSTAGSNAYTVSSDSGDLVRALTLVAGLKKIRHIPFYAKILTLLITHH